MGQLTKQLDINFVEAVRYCDSVPKQFLFDRLSASFENVLCEFNHARYVSSRTAHPSQ